MKPTKPTSIRLSEEALIDVAIIKAHMGFEKDVDAIRWSIRQLARHLRRLEQRSQKRLMRKGNQG